MAFRKIQPSDYAGKGNIGRPDTPGVDTRAMQEILDQLSLEVLVPFHNLLVDELGSVQAGASGAANIGSAAITGMTGLPTNVRDQIIAVYNEAKKAIPAGSITTAMIADKAVTEAKLGDKAVGSAKLGDKAVTSAKLGDGAVTEAKIGNKAVTSDKLADNSVTNEAILNKAVTQPKIGDKAVTEPKIGDGAVTDVKLGTRTIDQNTSAAGTNTAQLTVLLSLIVKAIKGLGGETNWYTAPGKNLKALAGNVLQKDNTTVFTPTGDYNPATKKYVDSKVTALRFVYECTGVDDDLAIETIINNFFNNSDDMSMNLVITGTFVPRFAPPIINGQETCIYVNSKNTRGATVNIDWSDCHIDRSKFTARPGNNLVFFATEGNCNINMTALRLPWSIPYVDGQLLEITGGRVIMINCNISAHKLFDIKNGGKLTFSGGVVSMNWQPWTTEGTVVNWIGCEIPGLGIDGGYGTLNFIGCNISPSVDFSNGGPVHFIGCTLAGALEAYNRIVFVDSCTIHGSVYARAGTKLYMNNSYLWRTLIISATSGQLYAMVKISGGRIESPSAVPCIQIPESGYECIDISNCTMRSTNDHAILVSAANADNRINLTNCRVRGKTLDVNQTAAVSTVKWNVIGCDFQTGIKINNVTSLNGTTNAYLYMPAYSNRMGLIT